MKDERFIELMTNLGMPNSRSLLLALMQVAHEAGYDSMLYERKRCAAIAAPERFVYSDEEWRIRSEVRDAILDT